MPAPTETVYGKHSVRAVLLARPRAVQRMLLGGKESYHSDLIALARENGIRPELVEWPEFRRVTGLGDDDKHQGAALLVEPAAAAHRGRSRPAGREPRRARPRPDLRPTEPGDDPALGGLLRGRRRARAQEPLGRGLTARGARGRRRRRARRHLPGHQPRALARAAAVDGLLGLRPRRARTGDARPDRVRRAHGARGRRRGRGAAQAHPRHLRRARADPRRPARPGVAERRRGDRGRRSPRCSARGPAESQSPAERRAAMRGRRTSRFGCRRAPSSPARRTAGPAPGRRSRASRAWCLRPRRCRRAARARSG